MRRFFILVSSLFATQAFALEGNIKPNLFYNTAGKPELEIHMVVNSKTIQFKKNNVQKWAAGLIARITVTNNGIPVTQSFNISSLPYESKEEAAMYNIADILTIPDLKAGASQVHFSLTDASDSTNTFSQDFSVTAGDITTKGGFGDIFFAEQLVKETPGMRNGYQYIPYPFDFFAEGMSHIHFYTELYLPEAVQKTPVTVNYGISKKSGRAPFKGYQHTIHPDGGRFVMPVAESLSIDSLPSGNYYLTLYAYQNSELLDSASVFFQRINTVDHSRNPNLYEPEPESHALLVDVDTSFVGKFTPAQLDKCLRMLMPVERGTDIQVINTLMESKNLEQKRRYIYNHWAEKNSIDPKKAFDDYIKVVNYLQKEYGTSYKPGFETDRGGVYLRYGKPNNIIRVERETSAYPYEIWQYYSLEEPKTSNAIFLFYKPSYSIGDYLLLHSTVRGERRDPAWRTKLFQNQNGGNTTVSPYGSKVDEYMKGQ